MYSNCSTTSRTVLRSCVAGDHAAAIKVLSEWDRRLLERRCLGHWFEVRLRLIAAHRLSGDDRRAKALAPPLEAKAREARDWLSLRRLARLFDPNVAVSPIATAQPMVLHGATPDEPAKPAEESESAELADAQLQESPLGDQLAAISGALEAAQNPDDPELRSTLLNSLLALGPDAAVHPADVGRMLYLARNLADDPARLRRLGLGRRDLGPIRDGRRNRQPAGRTRRNPPQQRGLDRRRLD